MDMRARLSDQRGFSIIEVLIAMTVLLIIMGTVYGIFLSSFKVWTSNTDVTEQQSEARLALNRASREIRSTYSVVEARANYLQLRLLTSAYSDTQPTGAFSVMTITYDLLPLGDHFKLRRSEQLTAGASTTTRVIADYMRNSNTDEGGIGSTTDLFHYWTSVAGSEEIERPVAATSSIHRVRLAVIIDKDEAAPPEEEMQWIDVFLKRVTFQ